jgi:hypothetical protein
LLIFNYFTGSRSHDFRTCSIAPQPQRHRLPTSSTYMLLLHYVVQIIFLKYRMCVAFVEHNLKVPTVTTFFVISSNATTYEMKMEVYDIHSRRISLAYFQLVISKSHQTESKLEFKQGYFAVSLNYDDRKRTMPQNVHIFRRSITTYHFFYYLSANLQST